MVNLKRGIFVVGCAAAFAAGPVVLASPASAKDCPWGTVPTRFDGVCVQGQSGGSGPSGPVVPPAASPPGADVVNNPNGYSSVDGIPCSQAHYSTCIALQQSQG